jgi:hypothetical protein
MVEKRVGVSKAKVVLWLGCISAVLLVLLGSYDYYIIQNAKEKTGKAAHEEYPLLIAIKSLHSAGEDSEMAVRGYLAQNGSDSYRDQYQRKASLTKDNINIVKKHHPSTQLTELLQKHEAYLAYLEYEVLTFYDSGDKALAQQNLEKSHAALHDIQTGYEKLITSKQQSIKKIEQEVELTSSISNVVLGFMSYFLVVLSAAIIFFILRKNKNVDYAYVHKGEKVNCG